MSSHYENKIIIAPMVRVGTLPFRLMAIDYGADLTYTDEIIDWKMLRTVKQENDILKTTDFVDKSNGTVYFRTCEKEKEKVIFQVGTSDGQRALKVGKMVEPYVSGFDVNMGCPKEFSLKGGMGAALLTQPEKIKSILTTLVKGLSIPVTCKIRILPTLEETLELARLIEQCGVAALAVHGRTKEERPNNPNHNDVIREITKIISIPIIANGGSKEVREYADISKFREETGASSVMLARAAMWNCSIVRPDGLLPLDTVLQHYIKYCVDYDNIFTYSKYTIQNILRDQQESPRGKAFLESQTLEEICTIFGLSEYFKEKQQLYQALDDKSKDRNTKTMLPESIDSVTVNRKVQDGIEIVDMPLVFIRGHYTNADLPKMILNTYLYHNELPDAIFSHEEHDKYFYAYVIVDGIKYTSSVKEKSRRYAEQGSVLVCLHALGIVGKTYGFVPPDGARKYQNAVYQGSKGSKEVDGKEKRYLDYHQEIRKKSKRTKCECTNIEKESKQNSCLAKENCKIGKNLSKDNTMIEDTSLSR